MSGAVLAYGYVARGENTRLERSLDLTTAISFLNAELTTPDTGLYVGTWGGPDTVRPYLVISESVVLADDQDMTEPNMGRLFAEHYLYWSRWNERLARGLIVVAQRTSIYASLKSARNQPRWFLVCSKSTTEGGR